MEVEAKFTIPDRNTADRLKRVVRLGPFVPGPSRPRQVRDTYYDTAAHDLYQRGYACRVREQAGQRTLTIKGLGQVESAIHERTESSVTLAEEAGIVPETWPKEEVWETAREVVGDQPLDALFAVEQVRFVRALHQERRLVAELSIDEARIQAAGRLQLLWVLEAELCADGTKDDLHILSEHLVETWGLLAEPYSKFHHGLTLLQGEPAMGASVDQERLTAAERAQLAYIVEHAESERAVKRAQLLLGWDQDIPVRELAAEIGGSRSWAYGWLARFSDERMSIFAEDLLTAAKAEFVTQQVPQVDEPSREVRAVRPSGMTVEEMSERFEVDVAHAERVTSHALALFDATAGIHRLGTERRRLLEVMGLLHGVGQETDPDRSHVVGCDIVLDHPVSELSEIEQRMLAAAIYLHRKRIKRKRLGMEVVTSLPRDIREDTLVLAALLRMADGLDGSAGQSSELEEIRATPAAIYVSVSGPFAAKDAAGAQAKADLWERLFDVSFFFATPGLESHAVETLPVAAADERPHEAYPQIVESPILTSPGLLPDDSMGEAGRKILRFHFLRMLKHESGTRAGRDIEELHDMRVATRRMRAALRIFGPYYKAKAIRPYGVGLRRTARTLGAVRDLDVLMDKAASYLKTLPEDRGQDLDPLLSLWRDQRERAREEMLAYLDGPKYQEFKEGFSLFVETPGVGVRKGKQLPPEPIKARHVMPTLLYTRWASVHAFDAVLDGAAVTVLHALRIECKQLRYALEFFREVLGREAEQVIAEVVRLQDHLGDLNDADVANTMLSNFLFAPSRKDASESVIAPGVVAYLAAKQRELQHLMSTFPAAWEQFNRPEIRRSLADAVAVL
jgi:CHAD domain-containing protein